MGRIYLSGLVAEGFTVDGATSEDEVTRRILDAAQETEPDIESQRRRVTELSGALEALAGSIGIRGTPRNPLRPEVAARGALHVGILFWSTVHGLASLFVAKPGLPWPDQDAIADVIVKLWGVYQNEDATLVEVNPLVTTPDGRVLALDAKFDFDDNALYRHPEIAALHDPTEEDPREVEAAKYDLNYIGLDGNIACLVNGAGLAMATMDIIKHCGGEPANFLDVGGGASQEQVRNAFKIILADPKVKAILVNIFGGIMDCDVIAKGIVAACQEVDLNIPLVVRLEGNNVAAGKATLAGSSVALVSADTLADAAAKAVQAIAV